MPSPFPGMDPFLESPAIFRGVHDGLIAYIREALNPLLAPRYFAEMGERIYLTGPNRNVYPDVVVLHRPDDPGGGRTATATALAADPEIKIGALDEPLRDLYVEIRETAGDEPLVAIIEVLSQANKNPGPDRDTYLRKVKEIMESDVHLVEVDLLADGQPTIPEWAMAKLPPHRYRVTCSRADERPGYRAHVMRLEDRLPRMRVPLRAPDPDVVFDLQAVFHRTYDTGPYARRIRYREWRPEPGKLNAAEEAFVRARLREAGLS